MGECSSEPEPALLNGRESVLRPGQFFGDRSVHLGKEASSDVLPSGSASKFVNEDLSSVRCEYLVRPPGLLDRWLCSQLQDKRDAPMAYLIFNILVTTVPSSVALFLMRTPAHWLCFAYVVVNTALYLQRFILCLHYVEHLQPFRNDTWAGKFLGQMCPTFLSPLYGIPPGVYRLHHVVMHHCENNLFPYDVSSTEPYQRDSFVQFLGYWVRFWAAIAFELPYYAFRRKRFDLMANAIASLALFLSVCRVLYYLSPRATIWVLLVPFAVASLAMMFGNWSQHAFIDPARSRNNYALTYNLVNSEDNSKTFNDGYHILHHINSKLHWSELPVRFMETLAKHAAEDAIIIEGLNVFDVGFFVFTGQLGRIADRYVNIGQKKRSREELIDMLKFRLQPIKQRAA